MLYKAKSAFSDNLDFHKNVNLFNQAITNPTQFQDIWAHLIWFSYRNNFMPIMNSKKKTFSSDTGWGCTLRASQMILAEAFQRSKSFKRNEIIKL